MDAFADRHTAPAEFTFCTPLPAYAQFFDGTRHKEPAGTPFQRLGCINKEGLERVGQFHVGTSSMWLSGVYHVSWESLILQSP